MIEFKDPLPRRYNSIEDWEADCREGGFKRSILPCKIVDGKVCISQAWKDAPYQIGVRMLNEVFEIDVKETPK